MEYSMAYLWLFLVFSFHTGKSIALPTNLQDAAKEGTVKSKIHDQTETNFQNTVDKFRDVISEYSSIYCKRSNDNCKVEDKHIRPNDVLVAAVETEGNNVKVSFYIRDHTDHEQPALTKDQLAMVFNAHKDAIKSDYGKTIEITDPIIGAWADWKTALVVCGSILFVALVIGGIIGYRRSKQKKIIEKAIDYSQRLSNYENLGTPNHGIMTADIGVANPKTNIMSPDNGVANPKTPEPQPQPQTTRRPQTDAGKTSPETKDDDNDDDDNDGYEYIDPNFMKDKAPILVDEKTKESIKIEDAYSVPYSTFKEKKDTNLSPSGNNQSNTAGESADTHL